MTYAPGAPLTLKCVTGAAGCLGLDHAAQSETQVRGHFFDADGRGSDHLVDLQAGYEQTITGAPISTDA